MILCKLVEWGEANVNALAEAVGLSQSALSQHLAKMRAEGLVTYPAREPDALVPHRRSPDRGTLRHAAQALTAHPANAADHATHRSSPCRFPQSAPAEAKRLLDQGAILVDIREADEHAREKIPGARHLPLSKLDEADLALHAGKPVLFHCKSGARTMANASRLAAKAGDPAKPISSRAGSTPGRRPACRS